MLLMIVMAFFQAAEMKTTILYVSTEGDDSWSGRLPEPNADRTDGPFATLKRARDEIRRLKSEGKLEGPAIVRIRGGIYFLEEPFVLTPDDSGTAEAPIVYEAYDGEEPIISCLLYTSPSPRD